MSSNDKLFVTGANGFVGGRIVEILHLTGYRSIRAGVRRLTNCCRIGRFPVDIAQADLLDLSQIDKALDGVSDIVHCAYGDKRATVEGTHNLLRAAIKRGIGRVVHLSTIEVYTNPIGDVDEMFPCSYTNEPYGDSKLEAEEICLDFCKRGLPVTILRLPIIYGPFGRNWTLTIAKMLLARELGVLEKVGNGKANLLYIDDLFRAIMKSLKNRNAVGQIFNINGPEVITWNEYFKRYNQVLGLPELNNVNSFSTKLKTGLMTPVRLFGGYLRNNHMDLIRKVAGNYELADTLLRKTEKKLKESLSPAHIKLFSTDAVFKIDKAKQLLDYYPKYSVDHGLEMTVKWLHQQGFTYGR